MSSALSPDEPISKLMSYRFAFLFVSGEARGIPRSGRRKVVSSLHSRLLRPQRLLSIGSREKSERVSALPVPGARPRAEPEEAALSPGSAVPANHTLRPPGGGPTPCSLPAVRVPRESAPYARLCRDEHLHRARRSPTSREQSRNEQHLTSSSYPNFIK